MDDYFEAKSRLFSMLKPAGKAVVNLGDAFGRKLASRLVAKRTVGFLLEGEEGTEQTQAGGARGGRGDGGGGCRGDRPVRDGCRARDARSRGTRLEIEVKTPSPFEEKTNVTQTPLKRERTAESGALLTINSPLLGRSNAENLLAAAAAGVALGLSPAEIKAGLESVTSVPGRLERIENTCGFTVLVDYAHKPAALEGVLKTVRPIAAAGGGRRDRRVRVRRRPRQGEAPGDGPHCGVARRRGRRDVRQPAVGGARGDPPRRARGRRGGRKDCALRDGPPRRRSPRLSHLRGWGTSSSWRARGTRRVRSRAAWSCRSTTASSRKSFSKDMKRRRDDPLAALPAARFFQDFTDRTAARHVRTPHPSSRVVEGASSSEP